MSWFFYSDELLKTASKTQPVELNGGEAKVNRSFHINELAFFGEKIFYSQP